MSKVTRDEVTSRQAYESIRDEFRKSVMAQKAERRIHLGDYFTFLFENHDTVLYQIQEMIRAESLDSEPEIQHEIDTYNELIGDAGELGATLLIEIDDPDKRAVLLAAWIDLLGTFYIETVDGRRIAPRFDARQVGRDRISSVHYLKFPIGDGVPRLVGCTHSSVSTSVELDPKQVAALSADLLKSGFIA